MVKTAGEASPSEVRHWSWNPGAEGSPGSSQRTGLGWGNPSTQRGASPYPESPGWVRDQQIPWVPFLRLRNRLRDCPVGGWPGLRPSEHPTRQGWAAQYAPRRERVTFFPEQDSLWGTGQKSVGPRVWDVPVRLGSGQEGSPLAWPHQPKPTQEMPGQPQWPAPHSLWLARAPAFRAQPLAAPAGRTDVTAAQDAQSPACPWGLQPHGRRGRAANPGDQQAARGARRYPGRRPPGCCWDPVSSSFEESREGSSLHDAPGRRLTGRQSLTPRRRRQRGD